MTNRVQNFASHLAVLYKAPKLAALHKDKAEKKFRNLGNTLLLALVMLSLTGCQSIGYLWQAGVGHWQLMSKRQPISQTLQQSETSPDLKAQLEWVQRLRTFAAESLSLPVGQAYADYADLGRPFALWNLIVAQELQLRSQQWCYPVAGCVQYQGYFDEASARKAAQRWREEGYDVFVGGVAAYSTLGWFEDPVLNTFLNRDRMAIAALLFHEIAHRQLYVPDDTTFNESWATAVEQIGLMRLVNSLEEESDLLRQATAQYWQRKQQQRTFIALVQSALDDLGALYRSSKSVEEKRAGKARIFVELKAQFRNTVANGRLTEAYAPFFQDLNNAKLLTVADYFQWVPAFRQKYQELGSDLPAFYAWSEALAQLPRHQRDMALQILLERAEAL